MCPAPMHWGHPKDAPKDVTELSLVAHATFECDLRERPRGVIEHELFGSKHPKSREISCRRQSEGFAKPVRKTAGAEACRVREVAHAYAPRKIALDIPQNALGTRIRKFAARSGGLWDTFDTLGECFVSGAVIASVDRCYLYGWILTLDHRYNNQAHW